MTERETYIKEMREYWQETRGSGIQGTTAFIPDNFNEKMGEYYDHNIAHTQNSNCGRDSAQETDIQNLRYL